MKNSKKMKRSNRAKYALLAFAIVILFNSKSLSPGTFFGAVIGAFIIYIFAPDLFPADDEK